MRRLWAMIPFSMILFVQPPLLSGAEVSVPLRLHGPDPVNEDGQSPLRLRPARGLEMRPDGFGGYLYSYVDRRGYKHVTNRADLLPQRLRSQGVWAASSTKPTFAAPISAPGKPNKLGCFIGGNSPGHSDDDLFTLYHA